MSEQNNIKPDNNKEFKQFIVFSILVIIFCPIMSKLLGNDLISAIILFIYDIILLIVTIANFAEDSQLGAKFLLLTLSVLIIGSSLCVKYSGNW